MTQKRTNKLLALLLAVVLVVGLLPMTALADYEIAVNCDDPIHGNVNFTATDTENTFNITATPNDGYVFTYWLKDGIADTEENHITDNPYAVTLDANATFTAHFRDRYAIYAVSEDTNKGTVTATYTGTENGNDNYKLEAKPNTFYQFEKWTFEGQDSNANPQLVSVNDNSTKLYTAYFTPINYLELKDGALLTRVNTLKNGYFTTKPASLSENKEPTSVGSRTALCIPIKVARKIIATAEEPVTIFIQVFNNTDKLLAEASDIRTNDISTNSNRFLYLTFDPLPEIPSDLTIKVTLKSNTSSVTYEKKYSGFSVAESAENSDFRYLSSPSTGHYQGGKTVVDAGPDIDGVYARTDATTKALSLYFYGQYGVFACDGTGSTDIRALDGLAWNAGDWVIALGPGAGDDVTAVVSNGSTITLQSWNGTEWTTVKDSTLAANETEQLGYAALVAGANDVWTATKHWDGTEWTAHAYNFKSFQRVSDTEAYGTDSSNQRWKYDGMTWTQAAALSSPETASVTSVAVNGSTVNLGQDQNGDWYLFVQSRNHFIEKSDNGFYGYDGSDVYKWDKSNSKWVYQIISELNDPQDDTTETKCRIRPDGVMGISSPAPGVSVMFGGQHSYGANYLYADDVTITFDPGEGRILGEATLTAPILSEIDVIDVPGALLAGRDFGGWFYDADYTIAFDTNGVMPGANVTVYAKWTEKEGLTDELAFYRERALASLEQRYKQYSSANYSAANWTALQAAYEDGKTAINSAAVGTDRVDENINAALTAATEAMAAIPTQAPQKQDITVAVSMDANTLGLGYLIEPTLVTVEEGTQASVVITDLIKQMAREKFGVTSEGYTTYHESEPAAAYPWMMTGSVTGDFYLAQVYYPEQQNYKLPSFLETALGGTAFDDSDKNGNYLCSI